MLLTGPQSWCQGSASDLASEHSTLYPQAQGRDP